MNCRDCQERIAAAARDQRAPIGVAEHLARCLFCREFAGDMEAVGLRLRNWSAPRIAGMEPDAVAAAIAGSLGVARGSTPEGKRRGIVSRLAESPAALAVGGAAALAAGIFGSPAWLQQVAAGWLLGTLFLVSLVLLHFGHRAIAEGE